MKQFSKLILLLGALSLGLAACPKDAGDGCTRDDECPNGRYCQASSCAFDCTYDAQCPDGFRCTERGRCERGCVKTNGGIEACDGLDNDCDGQVDEDFPDLGLACQFGACPPGLNGCTPDGTGLVCDGQVPAENDATCNAFDDDCDGQTDEDAVDQPCPLLAGVCAGSLSTCLAEGAWSECDYGPDYIEGVDSLCDQVDNDCDGLTDEEAKALPERELGLEATDGLDNNCNGIIDEPGGYMVAISGQFAIDVYELGVFDNADCTGNQYGQNVDDYPAAFPAQGTPTVELYACSLPSILPSGHLSWHRAKWACQAQGKRLCTSIEYRNACAGSQNWAFPYGQYWAAVCNDGWAAPSSLAPNGSYEDCTNDFGCYDMSGNLFEWVSDEGGFGPTSALVGGGSYACVHCTNGYSCFDCNRDSPDHEFIYDKSNNCFPDIGRNYESYTKSMAYSYLGSRCCMSLP